jgi:hypothetical protein
LGGGIIIVKGCLEGSITGVKYPFSIQKEYNFCSTLPGSYAFGMSDMVRSFSLLTVRINRPLWSGLLKTAVAAC